MKLKNSLVGTKDTGRFKVNPHHVICWSSGIGGWAWITTWTVVCSDCFPVVSSMSTMSSTNHDLSGMNRLSPDPQDSGLHGVFGGKYHVTSLFLPQIIHSFIYLTIHFTHSPIHSYTHSHTQSLAHSLPQSQVKIVSASFLNYSSYNLLFTS